MEKYRNAISKLISQAEDHAARLGDSDSDLSAHRADALDGFIEALHSAIDELEGEWES